MLKLTKTKAKELALEHMAMEQTLPEFAECVYLIALQEVWAWGEGLCEGTEEYGHRGHNGVVRKRECPLCWQALQEEAEALKSAIFSP